MQKRRIAQAYRRAKNLRVSSNVIMMGMRIMPMPEFAGELVDDRLECDTLQQGTALPMKRPLKAENIVVTIGGIISRENIEIMVGNI